jgi:hypothetical protein
MLHQFVVVVGARGAFSYSQWVGQDYLIASDVRQNRFRVYVVGEPYLTVRVRVPEGWRTVGAQLSVERDGE